jgi:hypothetical protein
VTETDKSSTKSVCIDIEEIVEDLEAFIDTKGPVTKEGYSTEDSANEEPYVPAGRLPDEPEFEARTNVLYFLDLIEKGTDPLAGIHFNADDVLDHKNIIKIL